MESEGGISVAVGAIEEVIDAVLGMKWSQQSEFVKVICKMGDRSLERNWIARIGARGQTGFGKKTFPLFAIQHALPEGRQVVLWGVRAHMELRGAVDGPENKLPPLNENMVLDQAFLLAAAQGWVSVLRLLLDGHTKKRLGDWTPPVPTGLDETIYNDQLRAFRYLFTRIAPEWRAANWGKAAQKAALAGAVEVIGWVVRSCQFDSSHAPGVLDRVLKKCASDQECYCDRRRKIANMIVDRFGGALLFRDNDSLRTRHRRLCDRNPDECV